MGQELFTLEAAARYVDVAVWACHGLPGEDTAMQQGRQGDWHGLAIFWPLLSHEEIYIYIYSSANPCVFLCVCVGGLCTVT